ncbi:MAG: RlmE family RNA methyltransferase [Alphaproteobacteria bacterium]|nr:RlmE family RNA methyltransferase [Alphaproteobacteria bacterium]
MTGGVKKPGGGARALKIRLKTAKLRTKSSQLWLERQINDPYVRAAKSEGYRSRAAYKLKEMDDKHRFLKRGQSAVDLGAAPGGWTQVLVERLGEGRAIGVDIQEMDPIPGAALMHLDFMAAHAPDEIKRALKGPVDTVLSDMASPATGHRETDHLRVMALCETALEFAVEVLKPGGTFVCKVLRGGTERSLLETLKKRFTRVVHVKPPASRSDSAEMYVLAMGFR